MNRGETRKFLVCVLIYIISTISLYAQDTTRCHIFFRFDKADIDTTFRENKASASRLIDLITLPGIMIDSVEIRGYASPDGGHRRNSILSRERAASAKNFILQQSRDSLILNSSRIRILPMREDWEGLQKAVEEKYTWPNKDKVLRIMRMKGLGECTREMKIVDLDQGYTWWILKKHFMADLRAATVLTIHTSSYPHIQAENRVYKTSSSRFNLAGEESALTPICTASGTNDEGKDNMKAQSRQEGLERRETERGEEQQGKLGLQEKQGQQEKVIMSFRTNMLYDLAMTPNVGVEFNLGKGWAIGANWAYAWWKNDNKAFYWRAYGGELVLRKYFGKQSKSRPLSGHHIGIYGQGVTYDFDLGKTGILSKLSYGAGVEYGYSLPVTRTLNIDFGIGIGYLGGEYQVYDPIDEHYVWRETRQRHWFGPTKAEISLVWLIGNKAFRKGGAR